MSRVFLTLLLLFSLPLQGYAAVAMPVCQHRTADEGALASDHLQHQASTAMECDDCAYCELCASPALPLTEIIATPDAHPAYNFSRLAQFVLFFPEQPKRPPLH